MEGLQSKVAKVTLISSVQQSFSVTFLVVEIIKMVRVYFPPHCHLMRLWLLLLKKKGDLLNLGCTFLRCLWRCKGTYVSDVFL